MDALADPVDLLVDFRPVVVSFLTGSGDRELNSRRMPSSNTGDFPQTFVSLPRQFFRVPTRSDTCKDTTLTTRVER